jgi:uncharacterized protein (TIGR03435 family)
MTAAQFEVASIKPSAGEQDTTYYSPAGERFQVDAATVKGLIAYAYNVREFQIVNAPAWAASDRFDILAKMIEPPPDDGLSSENVRSMVRDLLADRMALHLHNDKKEMAALALTVAKGTPELHASRFRRGPTMRGRPGSISGRNLTLDVLASVLSERVERPVLNQTGIAGQFDINLRWVPEDSTETGPSLFTAMQEQLGLKLESQHALTDILVVDHVEHPSPN